MRGSSPISGDEKSYQFGVVFTATARANDHADLVQRFLRAYRKGARDYHEAFTGPKGERIDGPTAPAILDILAKYVSVPRDRLAAAVSYIDADARLDVADVLHQVAWYKSQKLLKSEIDAEPLIDRRYVTPLPPR